MAKKYDVSTYLPEDTNIRCFCRPGSNPKTTIEYVELNKTTGDVIRVVPMMIKPDGACDLPWPNQVNNKWFTPYGAKGKLTDAKEYDLTYVPASKHNSQSQAMQDYYANVADGTTTPKAPKEVKAPRYITENELKVLTDEEVEELKIYEGAIMALKAKAAERIAQAEADAKAAAKQSKKETEEFVQFVLGLKLAGKSQEEIAKAAATWKPSNNS